MRTALIATCLLGLLAPAGLAAAGADGCDPGIEFRLFEVRWPCPGDGGIGVPVPLTGCLTQSDREGAHDADAGAYVDGTTVGVYASAGGAGVLVTFGVVGFCVPQTTLP